MEHVLIEYGSESVVMSWDGAQASAPIRVDGETTQYQTADTQHRTDRAVRLACCEAWSPVVDDDEDVDDDDEVVLWSDVAYRNVEKSDVKSWTNVASYVATTVLPSIQPPPRVPEFDEFEWDEDPLDGSLEE